MSVIQDQVDGLVESLEGPDKIPPIRCDDGDHPPDKRFKGRSHVLEGRGEVNDSKLEITRHKDKAQSRY